MLQFWTSGVVFGSKAEVGGYFKKVKSENSQRFLNAGGKTKKKWEKNGNFCAKPVFDLIDYFI